MRRVFTTKAATVNEERHKNRCDCVQILVCIGTLDKVNGVYERIMEKDTQDSA
jgi:hypothetical protein